MLKAVLDVIHTSFLAGWFGCMCYSVMLVQRHPARWREPQAYEDFVTELANGVRLIVLGTITVIVPSWVGVISLRIFGDPSPNGVWLSVVAAKSALLVLVVLLFIYLSWHLFPMRIFALPQELPVLQRRFFNISLGIVSMLGSALALGVVANYL